MKKGFNKKKILEMFLVLVTKSFWHFVGVPALFHSDFPWELVVYAIMRNSI